MTETPAVSIYEKTFAKSDKTDAILVVQGKKLHVNKALLSYHSGYFNALFNSDFKEKLMEEIPINDVKFKDFATVLSLVHSNPIKIEKRYMEEQLKIADRFQLPAAKRHLELYLKSSTMGCDQRLILADKYQLNELLNYELDQYKQRDDFREYKDRYKDIKFRLFDLLSNETNVRLFHKLLEIDDKSDKKTVPTTSMSIYESTFAESNKTDAILVVDGKKLHVNKAVLSYHSDYFKTLFNSYFKKKSMKKIEIKDVNFEAFATLLSIFHLYPIEPTKANAEKVLELSERFLLPSVKEHIESFMTILDIDHLDKIRIGEKYKLEKLLQNSVDKMNDSEFDKITEKTVYKGFSSETKKKLFHRYLKI